MRRLAVSILLFGALASVLASAASASCIRTTVAEQRARADVIFDGRALDGPTATGIQRFRVSGYIKGRGPAIVRVQTGTTRSPDVTPSLSNRRSVRRSVGHAECL